MATPSILRRLGDTVKKYSPFPDENELESLKEKEKTIDQLAPQKPVEQKPEVAPEETVGKGGRYGDRPGEKRYSDKELNEMTHPLGSGKEAAKSIPVYDQGGDVSVRNFETINATPVNNGGRGASTAPPELYADSVRPKAKSYDSSTTSATSPEGTGSVGGMRDEGLDAPHYMPGGGPTEPAPAMPKIPVYDEGGDVDVADGKHQMAVLENGERVLTPQETQQYEQNHEKHGPEMSTSDFPSATSEQKTPRVLANPDNVQPQDSDTATVSPMRLPKGAKLSTDLAPLQTPEGNINNAEGNQVEALGHEASTVPSSETLTGRKPKLDPNSPVGKVIQQDKEQAASNGDLVGLGKAVLNERHLATDVNAQHGTGEVSFKAKLKDYDNQILAAMDKAAQTNDPAYQEQADRLRLAKMEYQKMNPWGSANNHPGVLGKIGHVAAKIGNIAGEATVPRILENIPGTDLNKNIQRGALGAALTADTQARIQQEAEQNKLKIAELGRTPEQATFRSLLKQTNPATNKPYTEEEALEATKSDAANKEKEQYINNQLKEINHTTGKNFTREEATENYYKMRAGTKPLNAKDAALKDFMAAHKLEDTPNNRDLARVEVEKRDTAAKAEAGLPTAEQKLRLSSQLQESNAELNRIGANSLQRGEKADDFVQKENARHTMRVTQLDAAQNALDNSDTNMLAASIVPVLATMTETTAQGIKRLNPQELARFMPKSSGDAQQWFASNYDKVVSGQIPETYRADLRELLNNLAQEEQVQNDTNLKSIDQTFKTGATTPVVNEKGKATTTKKATPAAHQEAPPTGATHTGRSSLDGRLYYLDAQGKKLGVAPEPKK